MNTKGDKPGAGGEPVSAAEFVRNFARLREAALQHPVFISNHGRVSHVLSSLDDFSRPPVDPGEGAPQSALFGLADWLDDAILVCNPDEDVIYANRTATAMCRLEWNQGDRVSLRTACPVIYDSLLEVNLRRTITTREPTTADLPSPFTAGNWLHFRCVPLRENTVMMIRDITIEVKRLRLADVKKAMVDAISLHGATGYVRLTVRGTIERADDAFCHWVGLAEDKLVGVPLVNLIDRSDRAKFRDGLEEVLAGRENMRAVARLVPNRSGVVAVDCAVVQLHGAYGAEGAVVVFTRHEGPIEG